jgi:fucose permease
MTQTFLGERKTNIGLIKLMTFLMFMMFAMTTDAVGVIIPQIIKTFGLDLTAAGAFHYATMSGIALSGLCLGFLADRIGRKATIIVGLVGFAAAALVFAVAERFAVFVVLLFLSGAAIGVFKTGALALIGDISRSTRDHTATMNTVEGFFGVGAIIGPAIVAGLLAAGTSWKWLYVIAGGLCVGLTIAALLIRYPTPRGEREPVNLAGVLRVARDPHALIFSAAAMLYVGVETAIYVWMPTLLAGYRGSAAPLVAFALPIFFVLRAGGRFLGAWMLARLKWTLALAICSAAILLCFTGALVGGQAAAAVLLPLSGLFMSVVYPTLNSKGISGFPKAEHGAVAGVILFFTCVSAVIAPLAMGVASDAFGGPVYGLGLACGLALILMLTTFANALWNPFEKRLTTCDDREYG